MNAITLIVVYWALVGIWALYYWWTKTDTFNLRAQYPLIILAVILGPILYFVGLIIDRSINRKKDDHV